MPDAVEAIRSGDLQGLKNLLREVPGIAAVRPDGKRTLLHIATDWPGHFPNGVATVVTLIEHGADVNARFIGSHQETPLHWAASCDDVAVLDALLDHGADIEARGGVIGGGHLCRMRSRSGSGKRQAGWSNEGRERRYGKRPR